MDKMKWKTKDGQELSPHEMATSHIKNCIKLSRGRGFVTPREYNFVRDRPPDFNGDMAQVYAEKQYKDWLKNHHPSIMLEMFIDELEKRNDE